MKNIILVEVTWKTNLTLALLIQYWLCFTWSTIKCTEKWDVFQGCLQLVVNPHFIHDILCFSWMRCCSIGGYRSIMSSWACSCWYSQSDSLGAERHCETKVSYPTTQHSDPVRAGTQTPQSVIQGASHHRLPCLPLSFTKIFFSSNLGL